jgi:hypothetical protein
VAKVIHQPFPNILPKISRGAPEILQVPDKLIMHRIISAENKSTSLPLLKKIVVKINYCLLVVNQ